MASAGRFPSYSLCTPSVQTSAFGAFLDVAVDIASRGMLWVSWAAAAAADAAATAAASTYAAAPAGGGAAAAAAAVGMQAGTAAALAAVALPLSLAVILLECLVFTCTHAVGGVRWAGLGGCVALRGGPERLQTAARAHCHALVQAAVIRPQQPVTCCHPCHDTVATLLSDRSRLSTPPWSTPAGPHLPYRVWACLKHPRARKLLP